MFHSKLRGSDLHAPSRELLENQTGNTLTKLTVVTLDGMGTVYPKMRINNAPLDNPFGILESDVTTGQSAFITCLGFMTNINTSAWAPGQALYGDSNGVLNTNPSGDIVATVIKQDAQYGIIYVYALINYITANQSGATAWNLTGNGATNPSINFLGTTDNHPLKFRTNNNPIAQFDENGRLGIGPDSPQSTVHLKPYVGYTNSGLQLDSFASTTNSTNLNNIYSIVLNPNSIVRVKFQVTARQSDGTQRASFTRTALFYKEGGNVMIQGPTWQSDFTAKSTPAFDVKYNLGINTVMLQVKAANPVDTYWVGNIEIEVIQNNL